MKSKMHLLILVSGLFLLGACSSPLKVSNDYDKSVDFTKYKTYAIYKLEDKTGSVSQLNENRLLNAIRTQMTAKGFTE